MRFLLGVLVLVGLGGVLSAPLIAQGVTTAAVRGTVRMSDGSDPAGARISARSAATGFVVDAELRSGRFLLQGLEIGGPYLITARRIGARTVVRDIGLLSLGEPYRLDLVLEPMPVALDSLVVTAERPLGEFNAHGGTASRIADSLVHHLPTLNRDLFDFVRLAPQISTRVGLAAGGISGGGVGFRFNQFLTNGVPERSIQGSQPPEFAGGKSLPFGAVGEYQVLLAPFDVRYGDFAGAAINTVTRSGTNRLAGEMFAQFRGDALARDDSLPPYQRSIFGFTVSGPIRRDQMHFLVSAEFQRLTAPMQGPYLGQPADAPNPVPVREQDVARLGSIMQGLGLRAGSGGSVENRNPLRNLYARVDAALPSLRSRAVAWVSNSDFESLVFARGAVDTVFPLGSTAQTTSPAIWTTALQLHTALGRRGGGHNEFFASRRLTLFGSEPAVLQPIVSVLTPRASGGGLASLLTGTPVQAQGGGQRSKSIDFRDNLTLPLGGAHIATLGIEAEWFKVEPGGVPNRFGTWSFLSLDSLELGLADRYEVSLDLGAGYLPFNGRQFAAYAGDQWLAGNGLSLTFGLRADLLDVSGSPPYNRIIDSVFGKRTDRVPEARVHLSPRAGFTWQPAAGGRHLFRGGIGIFTGRPPLAWLQLPLATYGFGTGLLRCGTGPGSQGGAPAFETDPFNPPTSCAGGGSASPSGDVELVDPHLRMTQTLRGVLAWDHRLGRGWSSTLEVLTTKNLSDDYFANINLVGPQSTDARGRVLYGTIASTGVATAALLTRSFPSVIELQNVSANHSLLLSAKVEKQFAAGASAFAAYTWSRVRDVQTALRVNNRGTVNWSSRMVSGRHEDLTAGRSLNDLPHRLVLAGTWRAPWRRWTTELAVMYVGESGSPFTYRSFGLRGLGDLNADGSNANDPIYVPLSATDPAEIVFDGSPAEQQAQAEAFEEFIAGSACLRAHRGRIVGRNGCREPWSHTAVITLRQRIPVGANGADLQLDLFNPFNLLDRSWGVSRVSSPALLEQVGQTTVPGIGSQPVFRFASRPSQWVTVPAESAFQLQLGIGYRF